MEERADTLNRYFDYVSVSCPVGNQCFLNFIYCIAEQWHVIVS